MAISGTTRIVALLGHPVDHSRSPAMHNAAFADDGLDLVYVALPVRPGQVATVLAALKAVGSAGGNVTVPHKAAVASLCDVLTDEAEALGAVNTFWWDDDLLHGDNTDVAGIDGDLRDMAPEPGAAVVLGTGGAARAAALALVRQGRPTVVVGRRASSVDAVVAAVGRAAPDSPAVKGLLTQDTDAIAGALDGATLFVNATPLGMEGETLPAPFDALPPGVAVYDCVYRSDETSLVVAARAAGATARDGRGMLLGQATVAYERWTGRSAPVSVMRQALERSLSSSDK